MTNVAVARVHVITHDRVTAPQVQIIVMVSRVIRLQARLQQIRIKTRSPQAAASPVTPIPVVAEIAHFMLA